jgi:hypothetical protein
MTAKQKAEKLVRKYYTFGINNVPFSSFSWFECRECALIAVDEIINNIIDDDKQILNYWTKVKQEIEAL